MIPSSNARIALVAVIALACCLTPPLLSSHGILRACANDEDPGLREGLQLLKSKDPAERKRGLGLLVELKSRPDEIAPHILKRLRDVDSGVRRAAAEGFAVLGIGDREVLTALEKSLKDTDEFVRVAAASSLGRLDPKNESGLVVLHTILDDAKHSHCHSSALRALHGFGPRLHASLPHILAAFDRMDNALRYPALQLFTLMGRSALPATSRILDCLDAKEEFIRSGALSAIAALGPESAERAIPRIEALYERSDREERNTIFNAVITLGPLALPLTCAHLQSGSPGEPQRCAGIRALGTMGAKAVPTIGQFITSRSPMEASLAIEALGAANAPSTEKIPHLVKGMGTTDPVIQMMIAGMLAGFDEEAVPALVEVLRGSDRQSVRLAIRSLGLMGRLAAPALPQLEHISRSGQNDLSEAAARLVEKLKTDLKGDAGASD